MSAANIDDVAQTLAEYERLAITSGAAVQIDPPQFSADGVTWMPYWLDAENPPALARATVLRDSVPTVVYVSWEESCPAEDAWRDLWHAKPMKLFGAYAVRAALRRAFREVIGDRREPDEGVGDPWAPPAPRDWMVEIDLAQTEDAVRALHAEAKAARAVTPQIEAALRRRLAETLGGGDAGRPATAPAPELSPDELARHRAFFEQLPAIELTDFQREALGKWAHEEPSRVRAPQDHLPPTNRAARRAASRKGRR